MQAPVEIAVVIPTMGSNLLCRAVTSIFEQNYKQAFQILIGLDQSPNERAASQKMMKRMINQLHAQCPAHITLTIIDPGYSTRVNAGGTSPSAQAGAMRTSLSFLANARYVAYLDEEAWWHPDHLSTSLRAIQNGNWSYSRRILTDPVSGRPLGLDQFESMGLEGGIHKARNLGYIDPSCLMIDKRVCETVLGLWNQATPGADRQSADFVVSRTLMQNFKGAATRRATTYTPLIQNDADGKERVHRIMETRGNQSHLGMDLTPWFGPIMPAAWTMPVRAFTKLRERRVMRFFPC